MAFCDECNGIPPLYFFNGKWVCNSCRENAGYQKKLRGIWDRNGRPRDRFWLQHKLDMTSSEKKWHADIKSRRLAPDGSIVRVKR